MNKKLIIFSLLALTIIFIIYFAKLNILTNEHQKSLEELQLKINNVQKENKELKDKFNVKEETDTQNPEDSNSSIVISDISIQSNDMYTEGDLKGYIYGSFKVAAKINNLSNSNYDSLKIASVFVTSIPNYEKNIKSESKAKTILNLKANEEREVIFEGFVVDHPETIQEIIISVMDNRNEISDIKKIKIKAAFSPESND